jgi:hypothetical protein
MRKLFVPGRGPVPSHSSPRVRANANASGLAWPWEEVMGRPPATFDKPIIAWKREETETARAIRGLADPASNWRYYYNNRTEAYLRNGLEFNWLTHPDMATAELARRRLGI